MNALTILTMVLPGLVLGCMLTLLSDRLLESTLPHGLRFAKQRFGRIHAAAGTVAMDGQGTPREPLPIRYPLGIAGFALAFAWTAVSVGWRLEAAVAFVLLSVLYVILQTDLAEMIIPNEVVFGGLILLVLLRLVEHPLPFWDYALASVGGSGFLLVTGFVFEKFVGRESMGGGDIKLYLLLGVALGIKLTLLSLFLASLLGLLILLPLRAIQKKGTDEPVPFGPFIAGGAWVAYLWGEALLNAYLRLVI
ncbi:A24 family peptidase [Gorillibacterium sp. CAU 1737]|uniref:prepilin peptidase n=1 Tax=Gorillibacterium sp. CAU 1737 TaxID=3140362 RepID=UPI003260A843